MLRTLRLALIWITAALVPIQGMASVAMLLCSHASPHAESRAAADDGRSAHRHTAHDHALHASASEQAPNLDDDTGSCHGGGTHKCSACASCCAGLALRSMAVTIASPDHDSAVAVMLPIRLARAIVDRLERPPRAVPA